MKLKDTLLALLVIIIWGVNFSIVKIGLEEIPPILFSALRFTIISIPAVFFIPPPKTSFWNIIGVGVFLGVLQFTLLFYAVKFHASAGLSSLILQAQVFFTIGLGIILFKEIISKIQIIGIIIAAIGFVSFFFVSNENITLMGVNLILLAAFCWAISNIIMKGIEDVNLLHFMIWVSLIPPIPLFILSFFTETQDPVSIISTASIISWGSLIYGSYLSTLLAFSIWGFLLKKYSTATIMPFSLLIPIVAIITSNIVLRESISILQLIGGSLILIGLLFSVLGDVLLRTHKRKI